VNRARGHSSDRARLAVTADRWSATAELVAALQRSRGTVTTFLEDLASEPIDADVLTQQAVTAAADNLFGLSAGAELVHRAVLLKGRLSGRVYVYARSTIAVERLPAGVRRRLEISRDPIGRVLDEHGLVFDRNPFGAPESSAVVDEMVEPLLRGTVLSRRYGIILGGVSAIDITEWFLQPTSDALATRSG
jgi:chorismate lyase